MSSTQDTPSVEDKVRKIVILTVKIEIIKLVKHWFWKIKLYFSAMHSSSKRNSKYANYKLCVVKSAFKMSCQQFSLYDFLSLKRGNWTSLGIIDFYLKSELNESTYYLQRWIITEIGRLVTCLTKKYKVVFGIQHKNTNPFVLFVSVVVDILAYLFSPNTPS